MWLIQTNPLRRLRQMPYQQTPPACSSSRTIRSQKDQLFRKSLSADSKKGRGSFESDKPPVVPLVRRSDGRVEFLVRENLQDVDEGIA